MTSRPSKLSFLLAVLAVLTPAVSAQEGGGDLPEKLQASRRKLAQKRERSDTEVIESREMTPEELRNARKLRGSRGQCRFVATVRPPKLLPGQSGTLMITAILQGQSVLTAPAQVVMTTRPNGDTVQFGDLTARPARVGTIHAAFRGQPVYENTAVFEVPITLSPSARLGDRAAMALELEFDIHDGKTGQVTGRYIEQVKAQVEIAPHVDPQVEARRAVDEPAAAPEPVAAPERAESAPASGTADGEAALGGEAVDVEPAAVPSAAVADESAPSDALPPIPAPANDTGWLLPVGGGAALLVLLLLLARKKR